MKKYILLALVLIFQTVISHAFVEEGDNEKLMQMSVMGQMCENPYFGKGPIPFYTSTPEKPKKLNKLPTIVEEQILLIQYGNESVIYILSMPAEHQPILGG